MFEIHRAHPREKAFSQSANPPNSNFNDGNRVMTRVMTADKSINPITLIDLAEYSRNDPKHFHNRPVTPNLAPNSRRAHHGQSGGSIGKEGNSTHNSFVLKILTLKPSAIKILPTLFVNPGPASFSEVWGEGGYPQTNQNSREIPPVTGPRKSAVPRIFQADLHKAD
jgi:hypothetical protein